MMGPRLEARAALVVEVSPEVHIPQDHLRRAIERGPRDG